MNKISRKEFIKTANLAIGSTGLIAILAPILAYFYPSRLEETPAEPVYVAMTNELRANDSRTVLYGRYPAIVVNTDQGIKGYSAVCTHFACIVKYDQKINQFACPCHAGFYDPLDGHVISGPPPLPLTSIPIQIQEDKIFLGVRV